MAAQKPTVVFSPAFSTTITACSVHRFIRDIDTVRDRPGQDTQFKRTHGTSRTNWDTALSQHLHGDLR